MNKVALESVVAGKLGITKAEAAKMVETVIGSIVEGAVAEGECVVPGLGKLKVVDKAATSGVAMGKPWTKAAHKSFKLSVTKEGEAQLA